MYQNSVTYFAATSLYQKSSECPERVFMKHARVINHQVVWRDHLSTAWLNTNDEIGYAILRTLKCFLSFFFFFKEDSIYSTLQMRDVSRPANQFIHGKLWFRFRLSARLTCSLATPKTVWIIIRYCILLYSKNARKNILTLAFPKQIFITRWKFLYF